MPKSGNRPILRRVADALTEAGSPFDPVAGDLYTSPSLVESPLKEKADALTNTRRNKQRHDCICERDWSGRRIETYDPACGVHGGRPAAA